MTGGDGDADSTPERHVDVEDAESLSLEEALSILGNETRVAILLALGETRTTDPDRSDALGYSALMERVDVADSGRFNYHLSKLVGPFVRKTDEGYVLGMPGRLVQQAVVAGTLTDRPTLDPFPVGDCPECDGRLTAAYHPDQLVTVECTDCETLFDLVHLPARSLDGRSPGELLDVAYQRRHHEVATFRRGVCPGCGGHVERALRERASITYGTAPVEEMAGLDAYAVLACEACNASLVGHPANVALTTPPVVGFFADHDRDAALVRWWDDPVATARRDATVLGDGAAVRVPFDVEGDCLRVVLDADLQVCERDRSSG